MGMTPTEWGTFLGTYTWKEAAVMAETCTEGGFDDWRLPGVDEFFAAVDDGTLGPWLAACGVVPGPTWGQVAYFMFWSCQSWKWQGKEWAWLIWYDGGSWRDAGAAQKANSHQVIFVRGGAKPKSKRDPR